MKKISALLVVALVALAAYMIYSTTQPVPNQKIHIASASPAPDTPAPTLAPTPTPAASLDPASTAPPHIEIAVGGDVLFRGSVEAAYDNGGDAGILSPALAQLFSGADIALLNLETSISTRGEPDAEKQFTFRGDPKYVGFLADYMGVDIVTLANNHTLDFGYDAFLDTLEYLQNHRVAYIGAGRDLGDARSFEIVQTQGHAVALLAASRVLPYGSWYAAEDRPGIFSTYNPAQLVADIRNAKEQADFAVVYVHWGKENIDMPEEHQKALARAYIDAGADAVIGSHPHVLQGFEIYNGKPIAYSLGNFIWNNAAKDTCALVLHITDDAIWMQVRPCVIRDGHTALVADAGQIASAYAYLESISFDVVIDEEGEIRQRDAGGTP